MEFAQLPVLSFPSPLLVPRLSDDLIQLTAMCWMREFIQLAGRVMLPYSSGILTAVLPCLSYDDRKKSILVTQSCSLPATATCREAPVSCPQGARPAACWNGPGEVLPPARTGPLDMWGVAVAGLGQPQWDCGGFSVTGQFWHLATCGTACSLHRLHSDIKEVANVCNQSLMKLVIPEDDEMDEAKQSMTLPAEPTSEESLSKPEAASSGESLLV